MYVRCYAISLTIALMLLVEVVRIIHALSMFVLYSSYKALIKSIRMVSLEAALPSSHFVWNVVMGLLYNSYNSWVNICRIVPLEASVLPSFVVLKLVKGY